MKGDRGHNGGYEKFKPSFLGGNMVALKAWNGKYVTCDDHSNMHANRNAVNAWERFYVYTTSSKEGNLPKGQDYLALKSVSFNKFVSNSNGDTIRCDKSRPGPWEKWGGWRKPIPWVVKKIDYDLKKGKL